jgi:hypothetical protein
MLRFEVLMVSGNGKALPLQLPADKARSSLLKAEFFYQQLVFDRVTEQCLFFMYRALFKQGREV